MVRLTRHDPATASRIKDGKAIIALRNLVVREYDRASTERTWRIVEGSLPTLLNDVNALMGEPEDPEP